MTDIKDLFVGVPKEQREKVLISFIRLSVDNALFQHDLNIYRKEVFMVLCAIQILEDLNESEKVNA